MTAQEKEALSNPVNQICPWSGKPVSPDSLTLYKGQVVGFCNPGCTAKFEQATNAFDKIIDRITEQD